MPVFELFAIIAITSGLLIGFVFLLRFLRAFLLHRTLRKAIDAQLPDADKLIERIGDLRGPGNTNNDDRNGMILVALAVGLIGFTLIAVDQWSDQRVMLGGALFPLLVGAVLIWRHRLLTRATLTDARDDAAAR